MAMAARRDLLPEAVRARLELLRETYVAETIDEGHRRLTRELDGEQHRSVPLPAAVARRLAELHALCELTSYLHGRRPAPDR